MNDQFESLDHPEYVLESRRRLPIFLKTLAILTFVGSFFRIIAAGFTLYFMHLLKDISNTFGGSSASIDKELINFYNISIINGYVSILNCVLCTIAAILMLRRKVSGYWVYMVSQVILGVVIVLSMFAVSKNHREDFSVIWDVLILVVVIAFCIMYTLNKKHLGQVKILKEVEF